MSNSIKSKNNLVPILIIAGLFFIFGFVTWINGALIPFMKTINELTDAQSYLVASASYISFVVMALPASYILNKIGYKKGMSLGLIIMAIGALVFIPAAEARTYWVFLTGIFIQGVGMTLLQTAANPYITILGPIDSGAKRIAIMGIANKTAGAIGSLIFGTLLLSGIDEVKQKLGSASIEEKAVLLDTMADSVFMPYLIMATVLLILGLLIRKAPLPHVEAAEVNEIKEGSETKKSIFQFPHLWLGVLTLFVYIGAEVIAGDTIIAYGISLGFPAADAKFFTTLTLLAMVCTYALGVFLIPKYLKQGTALIISAALGLIFSVCILLTTGFTSILFVASLGIANALVWPAIWPLTLDGLGKFTKTASALLIMAISGGAIIPPLYGRMVDANKQELIAKGINESDALATAATSSYWILIPCYSIILFFAIWGHNYKSWSRNNK
ncbi:glucose/galactose MFS transporter [Flavobacterium sp. GSP27]|uniref:sugar MFS transporter n=1 Tax=unclassified Flavobacterium TaxID=196869 RepID=UPI000F8230BE|nr:MULTISPECIES: sugar MFS transporter [unclassified Flavobacterium]RTY78563.1 glucose/galactose MFS transporter [Flavobacterium sp. LS1P28]RTY98711.1 glucose/galactose MFS transporter [Flavobacterium sp. RSP49]RTZ10612.1 glucose/galactose MFS transporter [Flavobacterium sp. GSP27]